MAFSLIKKNLLPYVPSGIVRLILLLYNNYIFRTSFLPICFIMILYNHWLLPCTHILTYLLLNYQNYHLLKNPNPICLLYYLKYYIIYDVYDSVFIPFTIKNCLYFLRYHLVIKHHYSFSKLYRINLVKYYYPLMPHILYIKNY